MKPAIVIPCYNRPRALQRLLDSLLLSKYDGLADIPLVFCVDRSDSHEVSDVVSRFNWPFGEKKVYIHRERLGLRENILFSGNLCKTYGAVIILEDDLFVSPSFYRYAQRAAEFYAEDNNIAGISLYSYSYAENSRINFHPLYDGFDTVFIQFPSSWGQMWLESQWARFTSWYSTNLNLEFSKLAIPQSIKRWPPSSWKKYYVAYLVENKKYFVYPRFSYTTNFGDKGIHMNDNPMFHVPLAGNVTEYRFSRFQESKAVYDCFFEPSEAVIKQMKKELRQFSFDVDIQGIKTLQDLSKPYLLSIKNCKAPMYSWDSKLMPPELIVKYGLSGTDVSFGRSCDFAEQISLEKLGERLSEQKKYFSPMELLAVIGYKTIRRVRKKIG